MCVCLGEKPVCAIKYATVFFITLFNDFDFEGPEFHHELVKLPTKVLSKRLCKSEWYDE